MTIKHQVKKEKEGTYYKVPFDVPENVEQLTISYSYEKNGTGSKNIIDIGLEDGQGKFLGWSGSAHETIFVGEYDSTNGYLSEPIQTGRWNILVGAYHVDAAGVEVTYEISFLPREEKLLFGDLHIHSDASDGEWDIWTVAQEARKKKLDFIGLANHNNYAENFSLPHVKGLTFIPAVEWTHYQGHMNFFGVAAPFKNSFVANSLDEMQNLTAQAKQMGAYVSVNHPKCGLCPYLWKAEDAFDWMEIWNGPMRPTNERGIAWWTELLRKGRRIPIVGGSDFHKKKSPVRIGNPVTGVYCASKGAADILEAINKGHAFVAASVDGVRLDLRYGQARMGDTVQRSGQESGTGGLVRENGQKELLVFAANLRGRQLILVTENGERRITGVRDGNFFSVGAAPEGKFAYVKAVRKVLGLQVIAAVSNPIYFACGNSEQ